MLSVEASLISAFVVGLLGGVHCVGMCGGIVAALSMSHTPSALGRSVAEHATPRPIVLLLAYNIGRIGSYTLAGALFGSIGWLATSALTIRDAQLALQAGAGLFMCALGLYLAGWWRGLAHVEKLGSRFWRRIEPLGRRLLPVRHAHHALLVGALWGWLPCGLVYSVLIWSIAAGNATQGALLMLSFGLGTLPNLLLMGLLATRVARALRAPALRAAAGSVVIGFGLYMLLLTLRGLA
ncbi:MAG: hypothetical protein AMJ69_00390 [Gammaproteobacteria bacterium SG8_47]|nr:MAG: hypothetical protein AMJ69_00390 [Gammaproteobacteria bacterium SG8_47]